MNREAEINRIRSARPGSKPHRNGGYVRLGFACGVVVPSAMKRILLPLLAIAAVQSTGDAGETVPVMRVAQESSVTTSERVSSDPADKTQHVLGEVRSVLEANAANKVVSLSIDPEYRGGPDDYLINVVLTSHERSFNVGVLLRCRAVSGVWKSDLAFLD